MDDGRRNEYKVKAQIITCAVDEEEAIGIFRDIIEERRETVGITVEKIGDCDSPFPTSEIMREFEQRHKALIHLQVTVKKLLKAIEEEVDFSAEEYKNLEEEL